MWSEVELKRQAVRWYFLCKEQVGLDLGELDGIEVSPRARNWLGRCVSKQRWDATDKHCLLQFAKALLYLPDEYIVNTIVHEICHMVEGSRNHDHLWKEAGEQVNTVFPYVRIEVYATPEETRLFNKQLPPRKEYRVHCEGCGHVYKFHRKTRFVKAVLENGGKGWHCSCGSSDFWCEECREGDEEC